MFLLLAETSHGGFCQTKTMAKVIGPLLSLDARGTIAKTVTFGINNAGNWVRGIGKRKYTRNAEQDIRRTWFKDAITYFHKMSKEEQWLWSLALTNYKKYGSAMSKNFHRWARCLFTHHVLTSLSFEWEGSPFPPTLHSTFASDELEDFEQIKADLETLTGLSFCHDVNAFFFKFLGDNQSLPSVPLGTKVLGFSSHNGLAIAILENWYKEASSYDKKKLAAHELLHSLMFQHEYDYNFNPLAAENIADEVSIRIADGELTPIYTIFGLTLSEVVPHPTCIW